MSDTVWAAPDVVAVDTVTEVLEPAATLALLGDTPTLKSLPGGVSPFLEHGDVVDELGRGETAAKS